MSERPALLQSKSPQRHDYGTIASGSSAGSGPTGASFVSQMLFTYVYPLFYLGEERQLVMTDLWQLGGENASAAAYEAFNAQLSKRGGSITMAMAATYGWPSLVCGVGALFSAACTLFAPIVLHHVVDAFAAPEINVSDLSLWLGAFFASRLTKAVVSTQSQFYLEILALRATAALKSLVLRKALRRSIHSKNDTKAVDISNLYTSDVNMLLWAAIQVNSLWILPLQIAVAVYLLYTVIGLAAFAGLAVIGVSMLLGFYVASAGGAAFTSIMARKDERMKLVKEVFGAIQLTKFNTWERQLMDKIRALREVELSAVAKYLYINALSIAILWSTPTFVSTIAFAVYALVMEQPLTAAKVFTAIALFNAIRDSLRTLPTVIQTCVQAKVSVDRLNEFLKLPEFVPTNVTRDDPRQSKDVAISVENGSFAWTKDATPLLTNANLTVKKGDLVVVHGAVGSGKSSLCSALLGEMEKISGSVFVRGRVAYYSQQTWIQNMTIRDNILFGSSYDPQRYQKVLDACGLLPDLEQFPGGDATEIGEKGINLSGGQKARTSLARACYSNADIFVLDSPLAAVDAVVQSEIFNKCICGLLEDKTIVMVTHSPDIIASDAVNLKMLVEAGKLSAERKSAAHMRTAFATLSAPRHAEESQQQQEREIPAAAQLEAGRLVDDEDRREGRVSKEVFLAYINAVGGAKVWVILIAVQILSQCFQIASDLWLSYWTGQSTGDPNTGQIDRYLSIYALLGSGVALTLFESMTHALMHAPLRFFDANPIGRIVNRYSDDISAVDFFLPFSLGSSLTYLFFAGFQLATALYYVSFFGLLVIPLVYLYIKIANFFLATSREISRLWKVAESPVLSQINEVEQGVALIRAFGGAYVDHILQENFDHVGVTNQVWLAINVARQWLQAHMQFIGCAVVFLVVSSLVMLRDLVSPGVVGLAFSYALSVDSSIAQLVQEWSMLEILMVSPERILEYVSVPPEGSQKPLTIEPPTQWPRQGTITFDNVMFSYKEGAPAVLKGLSFDIKNNEKIGIVGRTGAGKSSLTMALFRINELDAGRILIDGEDISTMPLRSLRSKLSIIPQSPVLFKGTLRAYMDPFDEFTDAEIWSAFEKVEMKEQIGSLENQLSYELSENGENFSVGERQMLCMARALLTQTRIVVMDEATASIDHATEKKLQTMIDRDFKDATVLTIAHRLATVLDSDRIMVLSDGNVVEFDSANNLVQNPKGVFYELAREGGYLDRLLS
ncbi:Abc transporter c family member 5, partial [Globisporangium splendens]